MDKLRLETEKAVRDAGKLILETGIDRSMVKKKGSKNYVTQVDIMVQELLLKRLEKILPGCGFITEESEKNQFDLEKPTWIIDPVDGTTNLMHDYRQIAVSVALFAGGTQQLGIVYNPFSDEMFVGQAGQGAYLNDRRIRVSTIDEISKSLIAFGTTPYDRTQAHLTFDIAERVFMNCLELRRSGCAALDIAYIACGRLDAYFELKLLPWDFAAGILILKEAGGRITNWKNQELSPLGPDSILATNGLIHDMMLEYLR